MLLTGPIVIDVIVMLPLWSDTGVVLLSSCNNHFGEKLALLFEHVATINKPALITLDISIITLDISALFINSSTSASVIDYFGLKHKRKPETMDFLRTNFIEYCSEQFTSNTTVAPTGKRGN